MRFEVYRNAATTSGRAALLTSPLAMPAIVCNSIDADTSPYPSSATRFAEVSIASDGVFGDDMAAQIARQTPAFGGSVAAGHLATAMMGIAG